MEKELLVSKNGFRSLDIGMEIKIFLDIFWFLEEFLLSFPP